MQMENKGEEKLKKKLGWGDKSSQKIGTERREKKIEWINELALKVRIRINS